MEKTRMLNRVVVRTSAGLAAVLALVVAAARPSPAQEARAPRSVADLGFPDLVGGLRAVPGCLGVETARTGSGKNVIFAWFENKKAVLNWYYSSMHQEVMKKFFPVRGDRKPLAGIPDDAGPILAVASITVSDKPQLGETSLPISQIAIELYRPLNGGIFLGGRFAPEGLKVPELRDVSPAPPEKE
jgi:hypothetical protein